mmetsp:Transcript_65195/g.142889  ORF Transcript_65195/g.142889 Transcript_65195/m.142889 type:complete len:110 (+) Transcript_65195:49-378(+)
MSPALLGSVARAARTRATLGAQRRYATTDSFHESHKAVMDQWEKITKIAIPAVAALALVNVVVHVSHGHHETEPAKYSYQKIYKKAFPWSAEKCGLFESACWAEYKASK